jgi:polysaccharide pyruvyl transferase WcaK-like protein
LTARPLTIGLMWHSVASDNLGVGALTVSQIAILEEVAARIGRPVRFIILGWQETSAPYVTAANVQPGRLRTRDLVRPSGFLAEVRRCDIVLDIGAGDSFSDIYGGKRFLKYMTAKGTVLAAGKPLIVSPQTIGPFKKAWVRRLALATLRRSAAVFTRDEMSITFLRSLGFTGEIRQASDVALRLPYTPPAPRSADGQPRVGINISGLLMNGGFSRANMFGLALDYPGLMRRVIERFVHEEGCEVHLVPHVISDTMPVEDDWRASEALRQEIGGQIVLAPRFHTPSEAKSYIAGLDFFMGARMHACIAAFSSGVPVVPIAYSRKFAGLFDALGYRYTVDCTKETEAAIEEQIFAHFRNRAALERDRGAALVLGLERLAVYEAELEYQLLQSLKKAKGLNE